MVAADRAGGAVLRRAALDASLVDHCHAGCERLVELARERGLGLLGYAGLSPAQLNAAARRLGECLSEVTAG